MSDLIEVDMVALEAATTPYRNALYHRSTIVEGIRKIGVRNMVHLTCAMVETGHGNSSDQAPDGWVEDGVRRA